MTKQHGGMAHPNADILQGHPNSTAPQSTAESGAAFSLRSASCRSLHGCDPRNLPAPVSIPGELTLASTSASPGSDHPELLSRAASAAYLLAFCTEAISTGGFHSVVSGDQGRRSHPAGPWLGNGGPEWTIFLRNPASSSKAHVCFLSFSHPGQFWSRVLPATGVKLWTNCLVQELLRSCSSW